MKQVIWVLWPAFIAAGIAEVAFFTLIDPGQLYLLGQPVGRLTNGHLLDRLFAVLAAVHRFKPDDLPDAAAAHQGRAWTDRQ